jgi:hypothetical protein
VREIKPPCATPHFGAVYVLAFAIGALWRMQQSSKVQPHRKYKQFTFARCPSWCAPSDARPTRHSAHRNPQYPAFPALSQYPVLRPRSCALPAHAKANGQGSHTSSTFRIHHASPRYAAVRIPPATYRRLKWADDGA